MSDLYYPHPLSLLLLLPFFFTALPAAAQSDNSNYLNCPSYRCDNLNISYPFWTIDSNSQPTNWYCGYQGFGIKCSAFYSQITLGLDSYYVRRISPENSSIVLADTKDSYYDGRERISTCPLVRYGIINLETLPLKFSTLNVNLSFHINCTRFPSFATKICLGYERNYSVHVMNASTEETDWGKYSCSQELVRTVMGEDINLSTDLSSYSWYYIMERGFELEWWTMDDCHKCEASNGRCGHHNKTGLICFCSDGTIHKGDCEGGHLNWGMIKLAIGVGSALLAFMIIFIAYCILKAPSNNCVASLKHKTEDEKNVEAFVIQYGALSTKRYKYNDIKKMTNSFRVKLGQGGFGEVFKGKLSDGRLVAVKVLNSLKANGQEFINEVASIGMTSHVNIVTLLGFCFEYKKRALVYEYMPNGSLEKFILNHVPTETGEHIGVNKLYEIALGIACGLDYLHRGCNTRILHLDIKPHNILLDEDFCPKIADFGLAKLYSRKESIVSMLEARGTIGYIAPEVYNKNFGGVSHKSDVYSYGMLLLEMVGGRKNVDAGVGSGRTSEIYFPDWIYKRLHKHEFLLDSVRTTEENDYARKMTIVGLWCIQPAPNQRPSISEVIKMLEGSMEALEVPPKPFFSSPSRPPATVYSTSESVSEIP